MRTKAIKTAVALGFAAALAFASSASAQETTVSSGHVDVFAFSYDDVADELDPANVLFDVTDNHKITMSSGSSCRWDTGDNWVLPRSEQTGKIWAGWNTDGLDLADFGGSVKAELVSASVPAGGNLAIYDAASNTTRFHTDASCNTQDITVTESHHHPTWIFTEPGTYQLTFEVTGTHATDGAVSSAQHTYTFDVG